MELKYTLVWVVGPPGQRHSLSGLISQVTGLWSGRIRVNYLSWGQLTLAVCAGWLCSTFSMIQEGLIEFLFISPPFVYYLASCIVSPNLWLYLLINTASIHSDVGWLLLGIRVPRKRSEHSTREKLSLRQILWDPVTLDLPSDITSDAGVQCKSSGSECTNQTYHGLYTPQDTHNSESAQSTSFFKNIEFWICLSL